jgi:hypothetical protein
METLDLRRSHAGTGPEIVDPVTRSSPEPIHTEVRMFRRLTVSAALGLAVLAGSAGLVSAHECYIVSRSDQGNVAAGEHSSQWMSLSGAEIFGFIAQEVGGPQLDDQQLVAATAIAEAAGAPKTLTVFVNHTIAEGTPAMDRNGRATDGKGVDHVFDGLINVYVEAYFAALGG